MSVKFLVFLLIPKVDRHSRFNKYINIIKCLQNDFTDNIFSLWGEGEIFYKLFPVTGRDRMTAKSRTRTTKFFWSVYFFFHGVCKPCNAITYL